MTKHEIGSLAIKLMGVLILFKCIANIPISTGSLLTIWSTDQSETIEKIMFTIMTVFFAVIPAVFALLIIVFSDKVTGWLIREQEDKSVELIASVQKEDVMLVAFTCIGLYLIVTTFPDLISYTLHFFIVRADRDSYAASDSAGVYQMSRCVVSIIQMLLGIWLFAGSNGIVKLWKKIRSQ